MTSRGWRCTSTAETLSWFNIWWNLRHLVRVWFFQTCGRTGKLWPPGSVNWSRYLSEDYLGLNLASRWSVRWVVRFPNSWGTWLSIERPSRRPAVILSSRYTNYPFSPSLTYHPRLTDQFKFFSQRLSDIVWPEGNNGMLYVIKYFKYLKLSIIDQMLSRGQVWVSVWRRMHGPSALLAGWLHEVSGTMI